MPWKTHAAALALMFGAVSAHAAPAKTSAPSLEKLEIVTASGSHSFEVEVMRTEPEREKGLMFRRTMAADHGMLFDFKAPQPVMMWMKNTYLPLDMVFVDASGHVLSTTENAKPMSEDIISSHGDALGVLEVNAGIVAKFGVKVGDTVKNTLFPK